MTPAPPRPVPRPPEPAPAPPHPRIPARVRERLRDLRLPEGRVLRVDSRNVGYSAYAEPVAHARPP
jgi:hypothetical protein